MPLSSSPSFLSSTILRSGRRKTANLLSCPSGELLSCCGFSGTQFTPPSLGLMGLFTINMPKMMIPANPAPPADAAFQPTP